MAKEKYLIIGDGIAGATAAETLRSRDADSEIAIITNEGEPLYNRVMIKDYAKGEKEEDKCKIHDVKWYTDRRIDLHLYTTVAMVDDKNKVVICEDGSRFDYTKLLVATGGTPRKYPVPNGQADGVYNFWTFADARAIRAAAQEAKHGVAIGAGLLGIDLAVIFAKNKVPTKYIMRGNRWWREGINKEGSEIVEKALADMGVECLFFETPTEFRVDDRNHVRGLVTDKGKEYPADIVGVAIGLNMNLRPVASSNVKTGEGILCDQFLRTSVPDVWAAGDIAQYFDPLLNRLNINGSWASAKRQGEVAALNMLQASTGIGEPTPFEFVDTYTISHFKFPVMSVGNIMGDEFTEAVVGEGAYRRLVFKDNKLIGAVLIGDAKALPHLKKIVIGRIDCTNLKQEFLKADFDFKGLAASVKVNPA
ncbi:MAG TPA: FAD-dependent oxidoreductase [Candidatus Thermoplasmatota archaeon]|nr:FAD-dependent oxidoreductase [Candidatus Thermoplasmatota archaeon]